MSERQPLEGKRGAPSRGLGSPVAVSVKATDTEVPPPLARADRRTRAGSAVAHTRLDRVDALRTLAILAVVLLHFPGYPAAGDAPQGLGRWLLAVHSVLVDGLFYLAVPTLAFMSGFLSLALAERVGYGELMRRKTRTILIPMLIWNAAALALSAAGQAVGFFGDARYQIGQMGILDTLNALVGLTRNPINFPLHFLRDLLVLFVLWPLWKGLVRHAPWAGLIAVLAVFTLNLDGALIRRDSMAVTFYLGALFGAGRLKIERLDALAVPSALVLAATAFLLSQEGAALLTEPLHSVLSSGSRVLAPLLVWAAAAWLLTGAAGRWLQHCSRYSFPVFLMHMPMVIVSWRMLRPVFEGRPLAYLACWVLVSALSVLTCAAISQAVHRRWPKLAAWAYGGR